MRLAGHPLHTMLVHFPIALWPAHWALHLAVGRLPDGVAVHAGFWLLLAGTALGWCAAAFGMLDLSEPHVRDANGIRRSAWTHASLNGSALSAFTALSCWEYVHRPTGAHGPVVLISEGVVLILMLAGNYFGGRLVWHKPT